MTLPPTTIEPNSAPNTSGPIAELVPLLLQQGTQLIKVSESKQKKVLFRIDPETAEIRYESRKYGVVPVESIKEIRTGTDAQHYCEHLGFPTELDRWITIVYVVNSVYKTLHILAPTKDVFILFESTIRKLHSIRIGLMNNMGNSQMRQTIWERQYFKLAASKDAVSDSISFDELETLCIRLNAHVDLEQLLKKVVSDKSKCLNFQQFQQFVGLLRSRPDIEALHAKICGGLPFNLTVFEHFMKTTQQSGLDSEQLRTLFHKYAGSSSIQHDTASTTTAKAMSVEDLTSFLMSEDCSAIKPASNDMNFPLSDYWISTSHNTYLVGNQLIGTSTVEGYIRALLCACRSVELDIYDGPQGPVVYHGRTFTSRVAVSDICTAIANCEVHCGIEQQDALVDIMIKAFGASLVRVRDEEHAKITTLPSPEELKGRIMVKTKNLLLSQGLESIAAHKKAAKAAAAKAAHLEVESTDESSEEESDARLDIGEQISELKSKWRKFRGGGESSTASDSSSKPKAPMSLRLASLLVYTVGVKYRGVDKVDEYAPEQIFSLSERKAGKFIEGGNELENLIRHTQSHVVRIYPRGTRVNSTNYIPIPFWAAGCQLVALNIQTVDLGYRINQAMFMRCGPQGYVLKPPALRDTTFKLLQKRTQAFFDVTIISAQQLPLPRDSWGREIVGRSSLIDPFVEVILHIPSWSEKPFLPKDTSYRHTIPSDNNGSTAARKISFATEVVKDNGFNPVFDTKLSLPFDFIGGMKELIFVEFLVKQEMKPDAEPLASYIAPLASLEQGFRHLQLHDSQLCPHLFSTLFVNINMGLSPSKSRARAYPLVQPGYNVPQGQNPNLYLPAHLQPPKSTSKKKKKNKARKGSDQAELTAAYVRGWHAASKGMGPRGPTVEVETTAMASQAETTSSPVTPVAPRQAGVHDSANIADVLQQLPPPNPSAFGPPVTDDSQRHFAPLSNPLPTPPRDLYELSPYNALLNLPQTTALLTSNYAQLGSVPPPNIDRRDVGRRTLFSSFGRKKEEEVRFVPVFINAVNPAEMPTTTTTTTPAVTPALHTVPQQTAEAPPIRFSGNSYEFAGLLNYSPHRVVYGGREYPTAMHLHEAMKFLPDNLALAERIRHCPDVTQVYAVSQDLVDQFGEAAVRSDWADNYISLMYSAVLAKFQQHANLRDMLLKTKPSELIYADEQDTFWGEGTPAQPGQNQLGKLLERVRDSLGTEGGL
ncbi:Phosphoinositide phospholipase C [Mycena indigotica]|uniref:Phosphoinositide phospholipase C n=1 Tax=Mycena indigotica TaxID=2126181 RepID=A0A8H6T2D3_9AGAR|nr:Phosphoinositide phospholipase C [Mycena indigotica]KAF7309600.1 Phosphoinositide phospholipase C [Mycena indigotica]